MLTIERIYFNAVLARHATASNRNESKENGHVFMLRHTTKYSTSKAKSSRLKVHSSRDTTPRSVIFPIDTISLVKLRAKAGHAGHGERRDKVRHAVVRIREVIPSESCLCDDSREGHHSEAAVGKLLLL